jgi:hypothetical protein
MVEKTEKKEHNITIEARDDDDVAENIIPFEDNIK